MVDRIKNFLINLSWAHVLGVIVLAGAFFYFTLDQSEWRAKVDGIKTNRDNIEKIKVKIEEAKKFELEFEQRKKQYADMVKELQQMQGALPKQFSIPDLLGDILAETKAVDLDVISIAPDIKEEKKELYSSLGINMEARGSFKQILVLLDRFAVMKRLVGVSTVTIARDGDMGVGTSDAISPGLKAKFKILAYRYGGN